MIEMKKFKGKGGKRREKKEKEEKEEKEKEKKGERVKNFFKMTVSSQSLQPPGSISSESSKGYRKMQTKEMKIFMYVEAACSGLLVLFAVFQLIRIHVRLWQLRYQSRRRNFLAKRLFHAFLCLAFLVSIASSIFGLTSFCFADPYRPEEWWCFPLDVMLKRLSSFLSFAAYLITLLFWTEFVYCINHNAATGEYFVKYKKHIIALASTIFAIFILYVILMFSYHDGHRKYIKLLNIIHV